jgi:hypothetical protein
VTFGTARRASARDTLDHANQSCKLNKNVALIGNGSTNAARRMD